VVYVYKSSRGVESNSIMAWIRKNPFTKSDAESEMIRLVAEQANLSGMPLSDSERGLLASENPAVDQATEYRLRSLVGSVIANQKSSGQDTNPRSFVNAIEWATDGKWPYVAAIAIAEMQGSKDVEQVNRSVHSGAWLIGVCLMIILLVAALVRLVHNFR
jgi:hypothetical protein